MTKKLNNYLLSKLTRVLGCLLALMGVTGCDSEKSEAVMYGTPSPTAEILSETTGLVLNTEGEPVPNVQVVSFPTDVNYYNVRGVENVASDGNGKYFSNSRIEKIGNSSVSETFKQLQVIASDKSGVYENDTMYVDVKLDSLATDKFKATGMANFTRHKKASEAK